MYECTCNTPSFHDIVQIVQMHTLLFHLYPRRLHKNNKKASFKIFSDPFASLTG